MMIQTISFYIYLALVLLGAYTAAEWLLRALVAMYGAYKTKQYNKIMGDDNV